MNQKVLLIGIYSDQELARFNATVLSKVTNNEFIAKNNLRINEMYKSVWGLTSSRRNSEIWNKLQQNDFVLFKSRDDKYYSGLISSTHKSKQVAENLWNKHHIYADSFELLFYIDNLMLVPNLADDLQLPQLRQTLDSTTLLSEIQSSKIVQYLTKKKKRKSRKVTNPSKAVDYAEPPGRVNTNVTRIIRDTAKSMQLKIKYHYACQICGYRLEVHNKFYSEVHHIWPLGQGGMDNFDNMIVLCPNHHAEFDMCAIGIDPDDRTTVIDSNSIVIGRVGFLEFHKLATSNLKYHYRKIIQK